jgi:hypothetical protein
VRIDSSPNVSPFTVAAAGCAPIVIRVGVAAFWARSVAVPDMGGGCAGCWHPAIPTAAAAANTHRNDLFLMTVSSFSQTR